MEEVGVLVISYGSRETAIIDTFIRSENYRVEVYVADKQRNPFNVKNAAKHVVIPDLNIEDICKFVEANKNKIDFGIVGPEKPIVEGVRDLVEKKTGIPMICPTRESAIEKSKVQQRLLLQKIVPSTNPPFKVFNPRDYKSTSEARRAVYAWLDTHENRAVVKPDTPVAGKGVGVWGDHFADREQLFDHFLSSFQFGSVIIEEKVEGEESSFQAFCDGKHIVPLPDTRDYKRAFDDDKGPNTGGMGSYKDVGDVLPFLTRDDRAREEQIVNRVFEELKGRDTAGLKGVPLYVAFMHTADEPKILEINSRPGDPEIMNILPILKNDLVDVCFKIIEGNLNRVELEKAATVVTYKVPQDYGDYSGAFPDRVNKDEVTTPIDLTKAVGLSKEYRDKIRVYPASLELRGTEVFALKSRAVSVVGIGEDINVARQTSLRGLEAIKGGGLWNRTDVASKQHIDASKRHMTVLRRKP
ncbi:ATP-grasp domain-containing protein [Candidatus Bathyarchaeota archaeon]|nr:ATP-grasp domain-containing protein [Candidatus Bathyarchaeota archaeon]